MKKTPKSNKHFSNCLKSQNLNWFLLHEITQDGTESMIGNLKSREAAGPNSIPPRILKEFKNILKIPFAIIINISFQTGIFPEIFIRLYKCLNKNQFGFRNFHSANHAHVSITKKIRQALDKDEFACSVFLDFQKRFDTVNRTGAQLEGRSKGLGLQPFQKVFPKFVIISRIFD